MCARSPNNDHYFDDLRTQWLKRCRPEITFTLTTPILSTYASGTYSDPSCTSTAISACQSLQFLTSQCSSSYSGTTASAYYSCVCQQEAVSQASLCEIYGASCLGSTVISSTLFINQYCVSGVSTQTPTVVSTTTSSSQQVRACLSSSSQWYILITKHSSRGHPHHPPLRHRGQIRSLPFQHLQLKPQQARYLLQQHPMPTKLLVIT